MPDNIQFLNWKVGFNHKKRKENDKNSASLSQFEEKSIYTYYNLTTYLFASTHHTFIFVKDRHTGDRSARLQPSATTLPRT